jgi:hypothetical protein
MELEMAGVDDKETNAAVDHWKKHFERIIS